MPAPESISVLLVDDHAVVRAGYKRYLELDERIVVVGEAVDGESAYAFLAQASVDVVVMDISMPGQGGLESVRRILMRYPGQRILIFTMHDNPALATQALRAGAQGYLTKSMAPERIVAAIHQVMQGQTPLSDEIAAALADRSAPDLPHLALAPREFEIFRLLANGMSTDEIGARLHLGAKTVANYQSVIRQKLRVHSAIELYQYAQQNGLA
jgi:DNA-binding NarL/FixJ family response regulator